MGTCMSLYSMMNLNLNAVLYLASSDIAWKCVQTVLSYLYCKFINLFNLLKEIKPTWELTLAKREMNFKSESSCHLVQVITRHTRNDVINRLGPTPFNLVCCCTLDGVLIAPRFLLGCYSSTPPVFLAYVGCYCSTPFLTVYKWWIFMQVLGTHVTQIQKKIIKKIRVANDYQNGDLFELTSCLHGRSLLLGFVSYWHGRGRQLH